MTTSSTIALRTATERDAAILAKLAALDSAPPLHAPAVVALLDGRPVAAASLVDASVVADPFMPTADVVELLQARVAATASEARRPRVPRRRHLRFGVRPPRLRAA
ncbi:MAG: hypothetical protein QOH72_5223 [Solirubrobacteraceae bacterium]|jgi:hypothetical protein|nr:hypothetical protein [Solirubrobacteraceae bacterium]